MPKKKYKDPRDVRQAYSSERGRSPYWEWCRRHSPTDDTGRLREPSGGDPSQFAEAIEETRSDEMQAIVDVLNEGGLESLTVRQRRAAKLVLIEGMTYRQASRRMGISAMAVHGHVRSAGKKLRKLCEEKLK